MADIPVYLFTGFLDAGKTSFIQETLADERFNKGERTLLIVCEEGEEDYVPDQFSGAGVIIRTLDSADLLTSERLDGWRRETRAQRVLIEYNGMWMLDVLYGAMPREWVIYQEFCFAEAGSFLTYNANMRGLMVDKLRGCELLVLNRASEGLDKDEIHRVIRGISRRTDIAYEYADGSVEYDDIADPLPFDKEAKVIEVADKDYALFYRDLSEDMKGYEGRTVSFKGQVMTSPKLPAGCFIVGRRVMSCCVEDIQFAGLVCEWPASADLQKGQWVTVTAGFSVRRHRAYGKEGPVLLCGDVRPAQPPEEPVATFY